MARASKDKTEERPVTAAPVRRESRARRPAGHPRPDFVNSLSKGLEILSSFSEGQLLGNQELVQLTGLPKATVSRLTSTLVDLGYLRVDPSSRKLLMGTRLIGLGVNVQREIGLQRVARPLMEALAREVRLTVSLATRDRLGMLVLEVIHPPTDTRLVANIDAGTLLPIPMTSLGLAYLVAAPIREREQLLERLRVRHGDDWPPLRRGIEQAHAEYARRGFVTTRRSWGRDVNGVGVPLLLEKSRTLYTFHCAGPSSSLPLSQLRESIGPRLVAMVREVESAWRTRPGPRLAPPEYHTP